jgi:hypothetical protein
MANDKNLNLRLKVVFDTDGTAVLRTLKEIQKGEEAKSKENDRQVWIAKGYNDEQIKQLDKADKLKGLIQKTNDISQKALDELNKQVREQNDLYAKGTISQTELNRKSQEILDTDKQRLDNHNNILNSYKKELGIINGIIEALGKKNKIENEPPPKITSSGYSGYNLPNGKSRATKPMGYDYVSGGAAWDREKIEKEGRDLISAITKVGKQQEEEYKQLIKAQEEVFRNAHKVEFDRRLNLFREQSKEEIRLQQLTLKIKEGIALEGENSITAFKAKQAEKHLQIERELQQKLTSLNDRVGAGEISLADAARLRTQAIEAQTRAILSNNSATRQGISARTTQDTSSAGTSTNTSASMTGRMSQGYVPPNLTATLSQYSRAYRDSLTIINSNNVALERNHQLHHNIVLRVVELIGLYRAWNLVLNSIAKIPQVGIELESTIASLTATAGGSGGMGSVMEGLRKEADRTGISLLTLRETFRGFQASTSLAGETIDSTWKMFTDLNTVITGLHLPADKASGIFLAMAQIFNKTKVQSEELVKQLGNLLPGAFASFAAANSVAFGGQFKNSLDLINQMKKGMVFAHDTVERFTEFLANRFAPAFALASHSLNAEIGRMNTSFVLLSEGIYNSTSGIILGFVRAVTSAVNAIRGAIDGTNNLGNIFKGVLAVGIGLTVTALINYTTQSVIAAALSIQKTSALVTEAAATAALTGATEALTFAQAGAIVTSKLLASALAFFTSKAFIIGAFVTAGIGLYNVFTSWRKPIDDANDFLEKTKENLDKVFEKPATLEMKIDADPMVKEATKVKEGLLKDIAEIETKLKDTWYSQSVMGLFDLRKLEEEKQKVEEVDGKIDVLREKAKITLQIENQQALLDISEVSNKMEVLALEAQGLSAEAANLRFENTYAGDIAKANKIIEEGNTPAFKLSSKTSIAGSIDIMQGNFQKPPTVIEEDKARLKYLQNTRGLSADETAEALFIQNKIEQHEQATKTLANYDIAINKASLDKQAKDVADYTQLKLGIEKSAFGEAKTAEEAAQKARISAELTAQKQLEEIKGYRAELNYASKKGPLNEEQKKKLIEITELEKDVRIGVEKAVSDAREDFNKKNTETAKEGFESDTKMAKAFYKDYIRDADNASKVISGQIEKTSWAYEDQKITLQEFYQQKRDLLEKDFKQQTEASEKALELAKQVNDPNKILEYTDRVAGLADARERNNTQLDRELYLAEQKKLVDDINLKYQKDLLSISTKRSLAEGKYLTGLTNEIDYFKEINDLRVKEIQAIYKVIDAKKALLALPATKDKKTLQEDIDKLTDDAAKKAIPIGTTPQSVLALKGSDPISKFMGMSSNTKIDELNANKKVAETDIDERYGKPALGSEAHAKQLAEKEALDKTYAEASKAIYLESYGAIAGYGADSFLSLTSSMQAYYGADSEAAQAAFIAYKAFKISEIIITTSLLAMKLAASQADIPFVGPALAAAMIPLAYAMGAIQIATVIAQPMPAAAHGGLTNVPEEQTYLLNKGERVLSPKQNTDFTNYLKGKREQSSSGQNQNNVYNIAVTVQSNKDDKPSDTGNKVAEAAMRAIANQEINKASRLGNKLNKISSF